MNNLDSIYKRRVWLIENFEAIRSMMNHTNEFKNEFYGKDRTVVMDISGEKGSVQIS